MKIRDILNEFTPGGAAGVAEGIDIGREWMTDTELDQYVPDNLQQEWRELVGYDEDGNVHPLWANMTGDYEPDVTDPQHRAWMVRVANKWFAMKRIPNVRFYDVRDLDDELEWLVQIGEQGVSEAVNRDRRGFLAGLAGFAAVSAMPPGLVSALSTPEGIQSMSVSDVGALLKAIRAYLPPYDQADWTGTFERWEKMADALRIPDDDLDAADKLDRLMRQYRKDPEAASAKLLNHLKKHAVDLTDVRGQTIDQWNDVATVSKADPANDEIRQMQQQIADYNARQKSEKTPGIGQAQTAATAATAFRDLVQKVLDDGTTASSAPPREKYMGRIEPTSSAPALPAPDRSDADIMAQLRDIVGRNLTNDEKILAKQEIDKQK